MEPPSNRVDEHGFPIPPKFDDQRVNVKRRLPAARARLLWRLLFIGLAVAIVIESPISSGGRHWLGNFCASRAVGKYHADDLPGALGSFDWAVFYSYDDPEMYRMRGQCRLENKDLKGSLDDFSRAIELAPTMSHIYIERSVVHQRLKDTSAALADLDLAVQRRTARDPQPFNARAYAKAVAGVDLKAALADAEQAIEFSGPDNASILDTRGYLQCLLGNYKAALDDLDRSIELTEQQKQFELDRLTKAQRPEAVIAHHTRKLNEMLAVMYYHRGLVYQKQGEDTRAKADIELGYKLGYNPDEGVF
jgi:tetratricopeptide (TPR) repeat protein